MNLIQNVLLGFIQFYGFAIIIYVLMSWIPDSGEGVLHDLREVLAKLCDPYLQLFQRFIPPIGGMVDISPIFALLVLQLLSYLIRVYL